MHIIFRSSLTYWHEVYFSNYEYKFTKAQVFCSLKSANTEVVTERENDST